MTSIGLTEHEFTFDSGASKTFYVAGGPPNGPLLIFVHGWIAVAETWKPQLLAFAALGFRVVAPDTRGYGRSTVTHEVRDYALERHVADLRELLKHLGRDRAVWIGHDWGAALVWGLAAHHPELCVGVVGMSAPYRTVEVGIEEIVRLVDRGIYPEAEFPLGQWGYQRLHDLMPDKVEREFEAAPQDFIKMLYLRRPLDGCGTQTPFVRILENKGWFGELSHAPPIDFEKTMLKDEPEVFEKLWGTVKNNGTFGPNAYYRNQEANKRYTLNSVNGGVLDIPVLFLGGRFDGICETTFSRLSEPMREHCTNLTECTLDCGHWLALENPHETNAAIARWLVTKLPTYWPGYWKNPFASK